MPTMSLSNASPSIAKTSAISPVFSYSQGSPSSNIEASQKRSSSLGGFGSSSQTRHTPQPRNNQSSKSRHKTQKKSRLLDEDVLAETAAMKSINSRKGQTSITHLMNFSLPARPYQQLHHQQRLQKRNPTWGLGSGYHAADKARYVHSNYRFIVRPDGEYREQAVDADVHLGWDSVLQILASAATQSTSCPICLSNPVAPRMAKCGHIFCLPCLIRYMHASDDMNPMPEKRARWKKCPICEDSIYVSEARPVRWFSGQEASMLQEGGDVLLRLLMRDPGTTLALPRDAAETYVRQHGIPWFNVAEMMDYARIMKGGEDYMRGQFDQEVMDLLEQEKEDELMFGDDTTWTRKAIASIEDAKQKIEGIGNPPMAKTKAVRCEATSIPDSWADTEDSGTETSTPIDRKQKSGLGTRDADVKHSSSGLSTLRPQPFFFYNALPNFFLSPLDIRILKTAFGDFSFFPSTILPRVEHISTGHLVDDDLRKRAKYMGHLPYGCEVSFLECDWTDIISPAVLDQFQEEIVRRRKRNQEKEAREERDRIRAEKAEEQQRWSAMKQRRPSFVAKSFSETDFQPLVAPGLSPQEETLATTPPWGKQRTHSSFATLGSPGTSPDTPRTVWGTAAVVAQSPVIQAAPEHPTADDGWLQGWEKDLLDETDAIAVAQASIESENYAQIPSSTTTNAARRGKKKKITLMSTNARRGA